MSKRTGIGSRLYIDGNDVSGNIGSIGTIAATRALLDQTDITQHAMDRGPGLGDGQMTYLAWWDGTPVTGAHQVLRGLRNRGIVSICHGVTLGSPVASLLSDQVDYSIARSPDATLAATIDMQASGGVPLEWGVLLTSSGSEPRQTVASAGNGSDVDLTDVSTAFGATLYVHVLSLSGTSVTVKVQDAATLPTYADVAGLTTTAITPAGAPTAQRAATGPTATIRRFVRIVTTGTFTNAVIVAAFVRNMAAQD
ncbi:MAG TPA: hypothetical protein VLM76_11675 [Patescibacteria group bacterium]|nr:hypothetical protein [Patescibacteria group bacterium]